MLDTHGHTLVFWMLPQVSISPASYQSPAVTWEEMLVSLCVLPPCCPLTEIKNVILPARGESS